MKIAIITDSSADLSKQQAESLGVYVTRMPLNINGVDYIEEDEISRDDFIKLMREGAVVMTSQPPVGVLINTFEELLKSYDHLIYIPISSLLSGTYQTANTIAFDFGDKITVIDAKFVASPLQYLIRDVKIMIDRGMAPTDIKKLVEKEAEMYAPLIPADIQYLKRGGRMSPATAAIANLLKIYPVLLVSDGKIDLLDKVRTHSKALKSALKSVLKKHSTKKYEFAIVEADADPIIVKMLQEEIELETGVPCPVMKLHPIIMAHTGPGSVAIFAYKKLIKE